MSMLSLLTQRNTMLSTSAKLRANIDLDDDAMTALEDGSIILFGVFLEVTSAIASGIRRYS